MTFDARKREKDAAGRRCVLSHGIFTPGQRGWMEEVERCITALDLDSFKGCTVGDKTDRHLAQHPWRMDDERLHERPDVRRPARRSATTPRAARGGATSPMAM
jgi:hypothetical protein